MNGFTEKWKIHLGIVLGGVVLSLLIIGIAKEGLKVSDQSVLIALVLVPLLIYGIVSGRLTEFKGPGGWGASFHAVAVDSVSFSKVDAVQPAIIDKENPNITLNKIHSVSAGLPVVLTLALGHSYLPDALETVVEKTSKHDEFVFVVFLNIQGEAVCYIPVRRLRAQMERHALTLPKMSNAMDILIQAVQTGNIAALKRYSGMVHKMLKEATSNTAALEAMQKLGLDAMVVVDEDNNLLGVAERKRIIDQMVVALAKAVQS